VKGLTDIPGIRVGHISDFDAVKGCTAILCPTGAVAGVDISGSASSTQETPNLDPSHVTGQIHGILLTGGSAFGLEAASGVRRYLEHEGFGFNTGVAKVPIVPAAVIFDLGIGKSNLRPTAAMGEAAASTATAEAVTEGNVGVGTGATVGKISGMKCAMKAGVGSYTVTLPGGVMVSSLVVVNAFGDVRDPGTGKIVAGARVSAEGTEFANTVELMKRKAPSGWGGKNTTLGVVATNAKLNKVEAGKLARFASLALARCIYPVNTSFDGDTVFALSMGEMQVDLNVLGVAAAESLAESILRSVRLAKTLRGIYGLG
jgi:L-aminopeptidase/D-esterase-like protein